MKRPLHLGFPPPLLGLEPVRLPVLHDDGERIALAKPAGVLVQSDPWYPRLPVLVEAVRHAAAGGRPEWLRLGIPQTGLWAVTDLDPGCHGPVLFARHKHEAETLRNACGSGAFCFVFEFLSAAPGAAATCTCDLPLARHSREPRMVVSHRTGKKALTHFERVGTVGGHTIWQARTAFPRRHQILVHAMECGIPVLGDHIYAGSPLPLLSRLKRDYHLPAGRTEQPLFPEAACYLRRLDTHDGVVVDCPPPPRWKGLLNQLRKHGRA